MGGLFPFLLAHWRAHWRLLATSGAGFLVVAFLLASAPLYLAVTGEASLRFELEQRALENLDVQMLVPYRPMDRRVYQRADQLVQAKARDNLEWMTRDLIQYGNTPEFFLILHGLPIRIEPNTPKTVLQFLARLEEHTHLVEGRWWQPDGAPGPDGSAEAVMGAEAAVLLRLHVGDSISVIPDAQDTSRRATLTLVGTVEPVNPRDEYWVGYDRLGARRAGAEAPPTVPIFVHQQAFLDTLGRALAPQTAHYWWFIYISKASLTTETTTAAADGIAELENQVSGAFPRATALTTLDMAFARHQARHLFTSAPLHLLLAFTLGVALLYLLVIGAILAERQRRELTLLRSRGAATSHLLLPLAVEATGLALLSLAAAPPLASLVVTGRLVTPLEGLSGVDLRVALPTGASYLLAAAGLAAGLLAFLAPAFAVSRLTGIRLRQAMSRPQGSLLVFRLYLDIFLLAVGGVLAWELSRSGGEVTRSLLGPPAQNPLLVVAPLLLLVGSALLFLRLLPPIVRVAGAFLTPLVPPWTSLGLWMLGRQPSTPVRLALLLTVATGAVVLAAGVAPTLAASVGEAAVPSHPPSLDPVLAVSLEALTQLVVPSLGLLTALGAILVGQAVLQERFVQVGVLQAIGMSQLELARWLVLEHLLVLAASLAVGAWLGYRLSLWVLPLLDTGVRNPFITQVVGVETTWPVVAGFALVAALALLVPLILALGAMRRSALEAGLRLGEEV